MGGSDEDKYDHPTQKPGDLMRRPILNHLRRGELVYDPFLGSGTTLAAAELNRARLLWHRVRSELRRRCDPTLAAVDGQAGYARRGRPDVQGHCAGAPRGIRMNRSLPSGDSGDRRADSLGPSGFARAVPGSVGLVGRVAHCPERKRCQADAQRRKGRGLRQTQTTSLRQGWK